MDTPAFVPPKPLRRETVSIPITSTHDDIEMDLCVTYAVHREIDGTRIAIEEISVDQLRFNLVDTRDEDTHLILNGPRELGNIGEMIANKVLHSETLIDRLTDIIRGAI
jgi:hypothetical protein